MAIKLDPRRVHELREEHGVYTAIDMAKREARAEHLKALRAKIFAIDPRSQDFGTDLRDILTNFVDYLED